MFIQNQNTRDPEVMAPKNLQYKLKMGQIFYQWGLKLTNKCILTTDTKPLISYLAIRLSSYYQEHLLILPGKHQDLRVSISR